MRHYSAPGLAEPRHPVGSLQESARIFKSGGTDAAGSLAEDWRGLLLVPADAPYASALPTCQL